MELKVLLTLIIVLSLMSEVCSILGIEFSIGKGGKAESVDVTTKSGFELNKGFTVCLRVMFNYITDNTVLVNTKTFNLGFYDYTASKGYFEVGEIGYHFDWPSKDTELKPHKWYSFCLVYDAVESSVDFTINGLSVSIAENNGLINKNLTYSLTTQLNSDVKFPFDGKITDLNMWNTPLPTNDIIHFSECNMDQMLMKNKMPIEWSNAQLNFSSNKTKVFDILYNELCPPVEMQSKLEFFYFPMSYEKAASTCQYLNGQMILPKSHVELNATFHAMNVSSLTNNCNADMWMPIRRSSENSEKWLDDSHSSEETNQLLWIVGEPNGYPSQNCVMATSQGFYDFECNTEICFSCQFKKYPVFHLRGPCTVGKAIDSKYSVKFDSHVEFDYIFQGFGGLTDLVGSSRGSWKFIGYNETTGQSVVIADLNNFYEFPFGRKKWSIFNDKNCLENQSTASFIVLSKCDVNEFTCSDGSCISIEKRCDIFKDCNDDSDEENCTLLKTVVGLREDPPLFHRYENGTAVNVTITVSRIGSFNEMAMTFKTRFFIKIAWLDWRLVFANLKKSSENFNYLSNDDEKKIWLPGLIFGNSIIETNLKYDDFSTVFVSRKGNPAPNSMTELYENEIFKGEENPLVYKRTYELELSCTFQLEKYPFDYQICYIDMILPLANEGFVNLVPIKLTYTGTNVLTQYLMFNYSILALNNGSQIRVQLTFQRIYLYHLTNTYMPSGCLLFISEVTLFFRKQDLDMAIGLSLTIMLVMYTMYQSISQTLPVTAYLKFIDVWLIVCLLLPFFVFVVQVFGKIQARAEQNQISFQKQQKQKNIWSRACVSQCVIMLIPILTFIFILCYVCVAIVYFTYP